MVHRRFACVLFQRRERERTLASPRELPISSNCSISPSSTFPRPPHPPSFFNFLSSPSFSIAFPFPSLSPSPSHASIDHDILIFLFLAPSPPPPPSKKDSTVHGTSPRLSTNTHNPPRKLCIRAQHTRERSSFSPRSEERPSTDGRAGTTDRISARTSPSRRSLRRIFSSTEDPRSRGATRACASPFLLLQRSSRRGCLGGYYYLPLLVTPRVVTSGRPAIPVAR